MKKPARPLERIIQTEIKDYLAGLPQVFLFKVGRGLFRGVHKGKKRVISMGTKGVSDLIGLKAEWVTDSQGRPQRWARFVALEVKRPGEALSPEQVSFLARVERLGGIAAKVTSIPEAAAALGIGGAA